MSEEIGTTQKYITVSPVVMTVLALTFFAFMGGIFVKGAFLSPPPVERLPEYCRGLADGDAARYKRIYDQMAGIEAAIVAAGNTGGLVTFDPEGNMVHEPMPISGPTGFFRPPDPANLALIEDACNENIDAIVANGIARGPSDFVTTTAPPAGGGGIPEVNK